MKNTFIVFWRAVFADGYIYNIIYMGGHWRLFGHIRTFKTIKELTNHYGKIKTLRRLKDGN